MENLTPPRVCRLESQIEHCLESAPYECAQLGGSLGLWLLVEVMRYGVIAASTS